MKSGIEEFDALVEQFLDGKLSFVEFTSGLWNKGYMAGKSYERERNKESL